MNQPIPAEGTDDRGNVITIARTKDDLTVKWVNDEGRNVTTGYSHHPFAINKFRELTGQEPIAYEPVVRVTPCHDDEHDWEWVDPEDADSKSIYCAKCGERGEAAEEEDDG